MRAARVRAYRRWLFADTLARFSSCLKGHRIVARRFKTPVGEIDLLALKVQAARVSRLSSDGASCARRNTGSQATLIPLTMTSPSTWC
jgi:Holliday junction resolvase-like predicted endonuclease